jgi:hypothetical protein
MRLFKRIQKRGAFMKLRTYAEINLDNLAYNLRAIRQKVGSTAIIPVIGHWVGPSQMLN